MKKRYFIELAFKGTDFHGWQKQPNANTIQEEVDNALSVVLKERIETVGAGRTDAGVHAWFYTAHIDSNAYDPSIRSRFIYSVNSILPLDIALTDIYPVSSEAHARFSALSRTYEYRINLDKNPFETEFSWYCPFGLDIDLMNKASALLLKAMNFKSFCKHHSQVKTTICKISSACWSSDNRNMVFTIEADRFLRNMVRAIVGTLVEVGRGRVSQDQFSQIIIAGDRKAAAWSAPAKGLFLTRITYPAELKMM